uniref:ATP synthase F0 subunit 8 n=2 Tax=Ornithodoros TaxID=6937 RepID=A0A3G2K004_ORNPR|nr:ATP synthase F0 subunit 8 [Ornithodoros parkeri]AYN50627.1 ATP synthase F0 subunit 8 [Ornithodoros parkeri]AYN59514.1 ATP synthase F0 subunit 8 [Ornithodoros turicata]
MPQLFPMNWNTLTFLFLCVMLNLAIFMYFSFNIKTLKTTIKKNIFEKEWKW